MPGGGAPRASCRAAAGYALACGGAPAGRGGGRRSGRSCLGLGEYTTTEGNCLLRHERTPGGLDGILVLEQV